MTPAATTPNSNMLCPKSRPAELETTLPNAATGDGTPDGGAPVPPSPDDEPEARSSLAVCPCTTGHPCGAAPAVVDAPAFEPGGGDAPDSTPAPDTTREGAGAAWDNNGATGARTDAGNNPETSFTAGCNAGGTTSATDGNDRVSALTSAGND